MSKKNLFFKTMRLLVEKLGKKSERLASHFEIKGRVKLSVHDKNGLLVYQEEDNNILLQDGKAEIMNILWADLWKTIPPDPSRQINASVKSLARLCIGDSGADSATLLVPKPLDATRTGLFHEVWRQDFDSPAGVPSGLIRPAPNTLRSTTTVLSATIPPANFYGPNGGAYINEAGLVLSVPGEFANGVIGIGEVQLTHKTFKSFPFDPALSMSATIQWDIYIVL